MSTVNTSPPRYVSIALLLAILFKYDERVDFYVFRYFFFPPGDPRLGPLRVEHGPDPVQPKEKHFGCAACRQPCPIDGVSDGLARNQSLTSNTTFILEIQK